MHLCALAERVSHLICALACSRKNLRSTFNAVVAGSILLSGSNSPNALSLSAQLQQFGKILHASGESVELRNDDGVHGARIHRGQKPRHRGTALAASAGG
jgi:hypothetical protein